MSVCTDCDTILARLRASSSSEYESSTDVQTCSACFETGPSDRPGYLPSAAGTQVRILPTSGTLQRKLTGPLIYKRPGSFIVWNVSLVYPGSVSLCYCIQVQDMQCQSARRCCKAYLTERLCNHQSSSVSRTTVTCEPRSFSLHIQLLPPILTSSRRSCKCAASTS